MFSASLIVSVWSGGMKYQLTSRKPPTAAASAGQSPPTADDDDDEQEEEQHHARQPELLPELREQPRSGAAARPRRAAKPSADAAARQRGGRRVRGTTNACLRAAVGWLTTWTSMPTPDSRITRPITEPRVSRCQRERRVAPMTIWVAFSARAASRSAAPTSAPTTSW